MAATSCVFFAFNHHSLVLGVVSTMAVVVVQYALRVNMLIQVRRQSCHRRGMFGRGCRAQLWLSKQLKFGHHNGDFNNKGRGNKTIHSYEPQCPRSLPSVRGRCPIPRPSLLNAGLTLSEWSLFWPLTKHCHWSSSQKRTLSPSRSPVKRPQSELGSRVFLAETFLSQLSLTQVRLFLSKRKHWPLMIQR